nr:zinc finger protein [Saccharothrix texasensis]
MGTRAFRWFPYLGYRHAIDDTLVPGDTGSTLCREPVVIPRTPQPTYPNWCWPTCTKCDSSWREREGIPMFSFGAAAVKRPSLSRNTSVRASGVRSRPVPANRVCPRPTEPGSDQVQ